MGHFICNSCFIWNFKDRACYLNILNIMEIFKFMFGDKICVNCIINFSAKSISNSTMYIFKYDMKY